MFEYNDYWLNIIKSEINKKLTIIIDIIDNYKQYLQEIKRLQFRTSKIALGEGGGNLNFAYDSVIKIVNNWFEKIWFPTIENNYIKNIEQQIIDLKNIINVQFDINNPFFAEIVNINNDFLANIKKINIFLRNYLAKKTETNFLKELAEAKLFRDICDFFKSIVIFPYWEKKGDAYLLIRQLNSFVDKMLVILERKRNDIITIKNNFIKSINNAIAKHKKLITNYWKHISFNKFINLLESNYFHYLDTLYIHFSQFNYDIKKVLSSKNFLPTINEVRTNITNQIANSRHNIGNIINYFAMQIEKINNNIITTLCTEEQHRIFLETKEKMLESLTFNEKRLQQISDELHLFENKIALATGDNDNAEQIQNLYELTYYLEEIIEFKIEIKKNFASNEAISTIDKAERQSFLEYVLRNINYRAIENFITQNETLSICNLDLNIFNQTTMQEILLQYDNFFTSDELKIESWNMIKVADTSLITANNHTILWQQLVFTKTLTLPKQHYIKLLNILYLEFWQSKAEIASWLETDPSPMDIIMIVRKINEKISNRKEFIEFNIKIFSQEIAKWNSNNINTTLCTNEQATIITTTENKFIDFLTNSKNNIETIFKEILDLLIVINENCQNHDWELTIKNCHDLVTYFEAAHEYVFNAKNTFFNEFDITSEKEFSQLIIDMNNNDTVIDDNICAKTWDEQLHNDIINDTIMELVATNKTHNITRENIIIPTNENLPAIERQVALANNLNYDSTNNSYAWWIYVLSTAFLIISAIMTCFFTKKISAKKKKNKQKYRQNKTRTKMKPLLASPKSKQETEKFDATKISLLENNSSSTTTRVNLLV